MWKLGRFNTRSNIIDFRSNYSRFCELLALSEECFARDNLAGAAALSQVAARYAYPANVGIFNSPRLEQLLLSIGKKIETANGICHSPKNDDRRKILHILSYGNPIGGDTRFAWRWIQQDRSSCHSVVITSQEDIGNRYEVPEILKQVVADSGGFLKTLAVPTSNPIEQARELRGLLQGMDLVVLHIYPYDIVPVLALAAEGNSVKTILANLSDHTFWIGASVAHNVAHLRRQSPDFLSNRRSLRIDDTPLIPIPLTHFRTEHSSTEAKRALGIDPEATLLLTIATPFKYGSPGRIGLLDLVVPVMRRLPQAQLIAVGPSLEGDWWTANVDTDGRIVAFGKRHDTELFYAAADIYLDSVPFSSITSLLEAGSRGIPLLGFDTGEEELSLLAPGAPGIDGRMLVAKGEECYQDLLTRLITMPEFRHHIGQNIKDGILRSHSGSGWVEAVEELYSVVENRTAMGCFSEMTDSFRSGPLNVALSRLYPQPDISRLLGQRLGHLPYSTRAWTTWCLYRNGCGLCLFNFLPRPIQIIVRRLAGWTREKKATLRSRIGEIRAAIPLVLERDRLMNSGRHVR